jgi:hypothetical protein
MSGFDRQISLEYDHNRREQRMKNRRNVGGISYSPALELMHAMHHIAGDREDRPYISMPDIDPIANNTLAPFRFWSHSIH